MRGYAVAALVGCLAAVGSGSTAASGGGLRAPAAVKSAAARGAGTPVAAARPAAPKAVVPKPDQDAGVVKPGDVLKFDFPVRNAGGAPLQIFAARADCGCVVPSVDKVVPPGATRTVRVAMHTLGFHGPVEKHIYLECDDPDRASILLTVKATLPEIVEVLPSAPLMLSLTRGQETRARVTLHAGDGNAIRVLEAGCDRPFVKVTPLPATEGEDPALEILVPADAPADVLEAAVRVRTNHPRRPWVTFKVFGQPEGTVTAQPPRIDFGHLRPDGPTPVTRLLALARRQGAFKVLGVATSDPALRVKVDPDATPRYCELEVSYVGGWKEQRVAGKIVIRTDDPHRPQIEVPYAAEVW
jgi:Protein of unknown function (DUF1573)